MSDAESHVMIHILSMDSYLARGHEGVRGESQAETPINVDPPLGGREETHRRPVHSNLFSCRICRICAVQIPYRQVTNLKRK